MSDCYTHMRNCLIFLLYKANSGTGLVGVAPAVVMYLICGSVVEAQDLVTISDIPDVDICNLLETKVQKMHQHTMTMFLKLLGK